MMFRGRIAAVSYLNTIPFIYGIEHAGLLHAELLLSPPADNVTSFCSGRADIALVPAGALHCVGDHRVITSFCLGAEGPVRTVVIFSNTPVSQITRLYLDPHSRTSVLLARLLCKQHWRISPEFISLDDYSRVNSLARGEACVLIGDKVFSYEGRFNYTYDLALEWQRMTGLPFVFAVWIARQNVSTETEELLQRSFEYGLKFISEAVNRYGYGDKDYAVSYLQQNISFNLDQSKEQALDLYSQMIAPYEEEPSTAELPR